MFYVFSSSEHDLIYRSFTIAKLSELLYRSSIQYWGDDVWDSLDVQ